MRYAGANPLHKSHKIGIVVRRKLTAARMKSVAARFWCHWMYEKQTGFWITRNDQLRNALKILSRLFFRPVRCAGSKRLKMKCAIGKDMAAITAGVTEARL